tara:strand:- start:9365 stop:11734 length:2370 start_codon:yes stop_codon:yes gene_type:complete
MAKTILGSLNINIVAKTKDFVNDLNRAKRKLNAFGRSANSIGKSIGIGLGAPLTALGATSVKTFASFEQSMAKVKAISGATTKQFAELSRTAKNLGATTRFTSSQVSDLQLNFSKLGLTPDQINKVTASTLNLALATGEDLAESARVGASTMKGFALEADEMTRITDVMAKSFSSSALDLEKFASAMANAQVNARIAGFTLEETTAMIATLVDVGTDASKAGTDLRTIFIRLNAEGISLSEAFELVNSSANKTATATQLVDRRAQASLITLAENSEKLSRLTDEFNASGGSAQAMANIMDNTLQGSLFKLKSAVEAVAIQFGVLTNTYIKPIVDALAGFISRNKDAIASFMSIAIPVGLVTALFAGLVFVAGQLAFAITAIAGVMTLIGAPLIVVGVKIGLIVAGVVALVTGIVLLMKKFDLLDPYLEYLKNTFNLIRVIIGDLVNSFRENVIPKFVDFVVTVKNLFIGLYNKVAEIFTSIVNVIKKMLLTAITFVTDQIQKLTLAFPNVFKTINDGIANLKSGFEEATAPTLEYFDSAIERAKLLGQEIKELSATPFKNPFEDFLANQPKSNKFKEGKKDKPSVFSSLVNEAKTALKEIGNDTTIVAEEMKSVMQKASDGMTDAIQKFVNTGKLSFRDLVSDILSQIQRLIIQKGVVNPILNAVSGALFSSPSTAGAVGAGTVLKNPSTVTNPFADFFKNPPLKNMGGAVKAGKPYLVGESGVEMFVPRKSGKIIPNHKMDGGGVTVNFNVQATDANSFDNQLAQRQNMIVGMIDQALNRQGRQGINA